LAGMGAGPILGAVVGHTIAWVGAEKWFMAGRGLSFGVGAACAALVREALVPALIVSAFLGRSIYWRGTDLGGQWRDRGNTASGKSA
jgi:ceramide glucosyltransferase